MPGTFRAIKLYNYMYIYIYIYICLTHMCNSLLWKHPPMLPSDRPNVSPSSSDPFGKASFPELQESMELSIMVPWHLLRTQRTPYSDSHTQHPFKKRLLLVGFEAVDYTLSNPSVVSDGSCIFDISTTKTQAVSISIRISQGFYDHQ